MTADSLEVKTRSPNGSARAGYGFAPRSANRGVRRAIYLDGAPLGQPNGLPLRRTCPSPDRVYPASGGLVTGGNIQGVAGFQGEKRLIRLNGVQKVVSSNLTDRQARKPRLHLAAPLQPFSPELEDVP